MSVCKRSVCSLKGCRSLQSSVRRPHSVKVNESHLICCRTSFRGIFTSASLLIISYTEFHLVVQSATTVLLHHSINFSVATDETRTLHYRPCFHYQILVFIIFVDFLQDELHCMSNAWQPSQSNTQLFNDWLMN